MWREQMQRGSFRGIPFGVQSQSTTGGRRLVQHEYPGKNQPWLEDMGRKARSHTLEMMVMGADYMPRRDALMTALERSGRAELLHPWLGRMQVVVEQYSLSESTAQGGMATFSATFVEAGRRSYPTAAANTATVVQQQADRAVLAVQQSFVDSMTVTGQADWVRGRAVSGIQDVAVKLDGLLQGAAMAVDGMASWQRDVVDVANTANALIQTPLVLAGRLSLIIVGLSAVFADPLPSLTAYHGLSLWGQGSTNSTANTPTQQVATANTVALTALVQQNSVIEAARVLSTLTPESKHAALVLRDTWSNRLDQVANTANDAVYAALMDVHAAMVADVSQRATNLPQLDYLTLQTHQPSLLVAHRLWQNALADAALMTRNPLVSHPAFLPAAMPLEYRRG